MTYPYRAIYFITFYLFDICTFTSSNSCHTCASKTIKYYIARLGVMHNVPHNSRMRHFCMISMSHVYWVTLSFTHITGIRLFHLETRLAFSLCFQLFFLLFPLCNEIIEPRIRARSVVWRIRQIDDIIILTNRESLYLAQFW